jgi:Arm DNA-binding domain
MSLTDTEIRKAKAKGKPFRMRDGNGMYLWVTQAGGKLWRWKYRYSGKEKLMSFGKYPEVSLSLARERHAEARKLLATGVDPMEQRKAERTETEDSLERISLLWREHWKPERALAMWTM